MIIFMVFADNLSTSTKPAKYDLTALKLSNHMKVKTAFNDQTGFFAEIHNSCGVMTDWEFFAQIGFPQQLQLTPFPL